MMNLNKQKKSWWAYKTDKHTSKYVKAVHSQPTSYYAENDLELQTLNSHRQSLATLRPKYDARYAQDNSLSIAA